ncbi:MAG: hypothetical protein HRU15_18970 [Planctomycetes bacterium]|nr:hypothetical protein [Planctomycetota bacterium]
MTEADANIEEHDHLEEEKVDMNEPANNDETVDLDVHADVSEVVTDGDGEGVQLAPVHDGAKSESAADDQVAAEQSEGTVDTVSEV